MFPPLKLFKLLRLKTTKNLQYLLESSKVLLGSARFELGMGANRTRIRELADLQPILLIRTNSQFARNDLRVGELEKMTKKPLKSKKNLLKI